MTSETARDAKDLHVAFLDGFPRAPVDFTIPCKALLHVLHVLREPTRLIDTEPNSASVLVRASCFCSSSASLWCETSGHHPNGHQPRRIAHSSIHFCRAAARLVPAPAWQPGQSSRRSVGSADRCGQ